MPGGGAQLPFFPIQELHIPLQLMADPSLQSRGDRYKPLFPKEGHDVEVIFFPKMTGCLQISACMVESLECSWKGRDIAGLHMNFKNKAEGEAKMCFHASTSHNLQSLPAFWT